MNFAAKLKNKSVGFWLSVVAAVLAVIGLVIYTIYTGKGGENNGLVIPLILLGVILVVAQFFYEGKFADILAVFPGLLFVIAMGITINGGIGNITDAITGVDCFGIASIAKYNYQMAGFLGAGTLLSIISAFLPGVK